jgi:hypothetical protein
VSVDREPNTTWREFLNAAFDRLDEWLGPRGYAALAVLNLLAAAYRMVVGERAVAITLEFDILLNGFVAGALLMAAVVKGYGDGDEL